MYASFKCSIIKKKDNTTISFRIYCKWAHAFATNSFLDFPFPCNLIFKIFKPAIFTAGKNKDAEEYNNQRISHKYD